MHDMPRQRSNVLNSCGVADGKGAYVLFHLDKGNYKEILAAVEAATGVKAERTLGIGK